MDWSSQGYVIEELGPREQADGHPLSAVNAIQRQRHVFPFGRKRLGQTVKLGLFLWRQAFDLRLGSVGHADQRTDAPPHTVAYEGPLATAL